MNIEKAVHDIVMLYISKKFEGSAPSAEVLTAQYIKTYELVSNKLGEHNFDSIGDAPQWPE